MRFRLKNSHLWPNVLPFSPSGVVVSSPWVCGVALSLVSTGCHLHSYLGRPPPCDSVPGPSLLTLRRKHSAPWPAMGVATLLIMNCPQGHSSLC